MSGHFVENDALAKALEVILARVRCEAIHGQTNNGRCVSCISWAKRIGVPRHLPTLLRTSLTPHEVPQGDGPSW